ncbi:MAG: hypothetical protein Q9163_000962 [Psora crenata]
MRIYIASPSGIGAAQDAARIRRLVDLYEKLPKGPEPNRAQPGLLGRYQARYFGDNPSPAPIFHVIGFLLVFGYAQDYYFHLRMLSQPQSSDNPGTETYLQVITKIMYIEDRGYSVRILAKGDGSKSSKRKGTEEVSHNGVKRRKTKSENSVVCGKRRNPGYELPVMGARRSSARGEEAGSQSLALWAEDNDIPAKDLAAAYGTSLKSGTITDLKKTEERVNGGLSSTAEAGKYVAIDCEMVGVGPDPDRESALARVSIVNYHGHQLYDSFVQPKEAVTDFRTKVSGITPQLLQGARTLQVVQADVGQLLNGKVLVGHALRNDLDALLLGHPKRDIRDTSRHPAFRLLSGGRTPALKKLSKEVLGMDIQGGEHSSIEDARATMLLFRKEKESFEREHMSKWGADRRMGVNDINGRVTRAKRKKKKTSRK